MAVAQGLAQFKETEGGEAFRLQNSKLLKVELPARRSRPSSARWSPIRATSGSSTRAPAGSSRMIKKAVTNEGTELMKIAGSGEVFLADAAPGRSSCCGSTTSGSPSTDRTCSPSSAGIDWDIKRVEGASGALARRALQLELSGTGNVALVSDGRRC